MLPAHVEKSRYKNDHASLLTRDLNEKRNLPVGKSESVGQVKRRVIFFFQMIALAELQRRVQSFASVPNVPFWREVCQRPQGASSTLIVLSIRTHYKLM